MNAEEVKAQIDAALEPLLNRITALETENQEIRAILKSIPQPKPTVKPAPPTVTPSSNNNSSLDVKKGPADVKKTEGQVPHVNGKKV